MKILFFIFTFLLLFTYLTATIINVPVPYTTIQNGINAATNSDTVLVQPGIYVENINYNGKLITVGSLFLTTQDTTYISSTTIDGNSNGSVVTFENSENSSAVLCGFTITNGFGIGGAIYCINSSPSLQNVTISDNEVLIGGGIYCSRSNPSLQNVTITGNTANLSGGGIYCWDNSSPSLQNVTITGNTAVSAGGGIYCDNSSPILINSILWNDSPQEIFIFSGSVTATYSDIQGGWTGTGNIDSDPLFVNPSSDNYHLQAGSPCIDSGDPDPQYYDPDGTIADMGAYYYPQPAANFTADITNGEVPLSVNFTDLSLPGSSVIDEWYWELGDGNDSSLQNPVNEYLLPGSYTVSLTVTDVDDFTDTETKVDYISVTPPAYSGPVWHISTSGDDVWGNGSEQYPFATIQHGINASSNSDTVLVQPGTYVEHINYNGKIITVGSLFLTTQETTYISSTIIDGNNSGHVVTFNHYESSQTVLCGFTITNGSAVHGGGIYFNNTSPSLQNVTITGNSADYGGGIYNYYYDYVIPTLKNVTITGNSATYYGGGIYSYGDLSILLLINSIMWNDSPEEIYLSEFSEVIANYSDIQGGWTGIGNINSNPVFVDPDNGDYQLQPTSPCIDAGHPSSPLDPDGTRADMGAYYFDQILNPFPPIADFTVDITNGNVPLTVNFTDLSTPGTGVIDEWFWDFGDGSNSSLQDPAQEYLLPGIYTVSLTVTDVNNLSDNKTKIDYITVYSNDPPAPPTNIQINISGDDAIITWTAVDTTSIGDPIVVDAYLVYYCGAPDSVYYFHGLTTDTTYTHHYVAQFSDNMFYQVVAYVGDVDLLQDVITKHPDLKLGELDLLIEENKLRINKKILGI